MSITSCLDKVPLTHLTQAITKRIHVISSNAPLPSLTSILGQELNLPIKITSNTSSDFKWAAECGPRMRYGCQSVGVSMISYDFRKFCSQRLEFTNPVSASKKKLPNPKFDIPINNRDFISHKTHHFSLRTSNRPYIEDFHQRLERSVFFCP